ncbi:carboxypeptidase-like regulatory domain-containing protein [Gemmatimonas sp.]|uniref:carboxypeptidase-like regulatory domain-containing protein n=1 Tax=Gemmatimonas sp. TaxID=1962908 RepID=UPI00356645DE
MSAPRTNPLLCLRVNSRGAMVAAVAIAASIAGLTSSTLLSAQGGSISGRVLSTESGRPIADAVVAVLTAARETRTDSLGRFTLKDVRAGEQELLVRSLGYTPARATVSLTSGLPIEVDVELQPLPRVLKRVISMADRENARNEWYGEFASRRATGMGRYISRDELVRQQGRSLDAVLRSKVAGFRVWDVNGKIVAGSARGNITLHPDADPSKLRCYVQVIVDNVVRYETGGILPLFDLRSLDAFMIAGIEFYTVASTPIEFNRGGNAPCGTLLIWMQN